MTLELAEYEVTDVVAAGLAEAFTIRAKRKVDSNLPHLAALSFNVAVCGSEGISIKINNARRPTERGIYILATNSFIQLANNFAKQAKIFDIDLIECLPAGARSEKSATVFEANNAPDLAELIRESLVHS